MPDNGWVKKGPSWLNKGITMSTPTLAQFILLQNRVTALDGVTSPVPSNAAVPTIEADLNGLHTTINQLTLLLQSQMNTITSQLAQVLGAVYPPQYTVSLLPIGVEGQVAYATNGLKVGESTGHGTGVPVYYSNGLWRVYSTDAQVQS
jgi:hypothetical protein